MKIVFYIAIVIVLLFYLSINYYIGLRGFQTIGYRLPGAVYWTVFWTLAATYFAGRFFEKHLPEQAGKIFVLAGAYWMAALVYFFFIIVFIDLIRGLNKWLGFIPDTIARNGMIPQIIGYTVLAAVVGILIYGTWNANNPIVNKYKIEISKQAGTLDKLHVVMISDLHLGVIINKGRLAKAVDDINAQNPDIILLAGDVLDEDVGPFVQYKMAEEFKRLKAKYGTYAILGNHEYYGGHAEEFIKHIEETGIKMLRDNYEKVDNSFYIVGRDNNARNRMGEGKRKDLEVILEGVDKSLPVILMDHEPTNLKEPELQGIDLQFSGHTHRGQLFPFSFITDRIFEEDWGYMKKGSFQLIVSSGYGTWGPPIRTGNRPEIVDVTLEFGK